MDIAEVLRNITPEEIEKFKLIASIFGGKEKTKQINLGDFYKEYLSYAEFNLAPKTVDIIKTSYKHLLTYLPGMKSLDEIGLREVELFIRSLQKNAPRGFRVYFRTLKASLNKAIDWGYIVTNPFVKVKLPKIQRNEPVVLDSIQLALCCKQIENETIKDIVIFGFYTGCRLGEIVNLTWINVDLAKRMITIGDKNFNTKGRKQRVVPMNELVYEMLVLRFEKQNHPASQSDATLLRKEGKKSPILINRDTSLGKEGNKDESRKLKEKNEPTPLIPLPRGDKMLNGFVFGKGNGIRYTTDAVSKAFKKAVRKAGLSEDIHFHTLRHSFASNLVQKGVPLYSVKELLGHSSIQMTEIYSHLKLDDLRDAVGKL